MTASAMNCYCGCNHYGEIEKKANNGKLSDEFPKYNKKQKQDHGVQFRNTTSMRVKFILKLHEDLKKFQVAGVLNDE